MRLGEEFHHNGLTIRCAQIGRVSRGLAHTWNCQRLAQETIALLRAYGPQINEHLITDVVPFDDSPRFMARLAADYQPQVLDFLSLGQWALAQRMASACDIRYGKRAVKIDLKNKEVGFADGSSATYNLLLSTLPLNTMLKMTGIQTEAAADPHTAVLVLNIGARRGANCPDDHWLYNPDAKSGFHRVGFYSNVDRAFLPKSSRADMEAAGVTTIRSTWYLFYRSLWPLGLPRHCRFGTRWILCGCEL